jgi:hypothetical protein
MRKLSLLVFSLVLFSVSFGTATSEIKPVLNANHIYLPVGKTGQKISLMELSRISMNDLQTLTNRKMNFFERLAFKSGQKKLRKNIAADGTVKKKKLEKILNRYYGGETGFHFGGFALGFFLGVIGVLIAYIINDDYKKNRVKWSWIGFGIGVLINVVLFIILLDIYSSE